MNACQSDRYLHKIILNNARYYKKKEIYIRTYDIMLNYYKRKKIW